jgi:hypothetical protein
VWEYSQVDSTRCFDSLQRKSRLCHPTEAALDCFTRLASFPQYWLATPLDFCATPLDFCSVREATTASCANANITHITAATTNFAILVSLFRTSPPMLDLTPS